MTNTPSPANAPRTLRTPRERLAQVVAYEVLGIAIVSPGLAWYAGLSVDESAMALVVLSLVAMTWTGAYNEWCDRLEWRVRGQCASARSHTCRWLHACGLELSLTLFTWPMLVAVTDLGWREALAADIGLTVAYVCYGYAFHLAFDWWRPLVSDDAAMAMSARGSRNGVATAR